MRESIWSWVILVFQLVDFSLFWIIVPSKDELKFSHLRVFFTFFFVLVIPLPVYIKIYTVYWLKVPIVILTLSCCSLYVLRCSWKRRFALLGIFMLCIFFSELLADATIVIGLMKNAVIPTLIDLPLLLAQSIWSILFLSVISILSVFWKRLDRILCIRVTVLFILLPVSQILLLLGLYQYNLDILTQSMEFYTLISGLITAAADLMVYLTITNATKDLQNRMELEQLRTQRETDYKYYRLAQRTAEETSKLRHDFKNQLQVAYAALNADNSTEARTLLDELNRQTSSIQKVSFCADPIVNAILTVKSQEATLAHIHFEAQTVVRDWPISEVDLSSLFSNLLDNAIEGCQASGQPEPYLSVKAQEHCGAYVVQVSNSCKPTLTIPTDRLPHTTKEQKSAHGYGLRIIQDISKKYHGNLKLHCKDGLFTAEVLLMAADFVE